MKAVILARVSTEEQKDAGNSLPAQIERMKAYCSRKGLEIAEAFSFDESAYKTKRDEFDKILDYLHSSKEKVAVCFDKVDRLSRNVFDKRVAELYGMALEGKIELHFVSDHQIINSSLSATEKGGFGMNLVMSSYYSNCISDNVKRAFEQKRRNGEWTGTPRIGYMNITLENGKKDIVLDPERAPLVKKIFELYATGNYSITTIWQKITELGLRSFEGNKLSRSNIDLILRDPFYYGMARSNKYGLFAHRYPVLISRELFEKCQNVRLRRSRKPSKMVSVVQYVFKGLLTCKNCGCLMTPELKRKKSGLIFIYYSCTNAKGICHRVYVPEKTLLMRIYGIFSDFERIPKDVQDRLVEDLRGLNEKEAGYHDKQVARIRTENDRLEKRARVLLDMRLDQSITTADYDKKQQEIRDQQYRLNIESEEHLKADHQYHIHVATVFNLARRMKDIFESSEPMEKRAFLNFLLQNPTVDNKKLEFTLRKPFNLIHELALNPTGLRIVNDVRTIIQGQKGYIYIPDFRLSTTT